MSWSTQSKATLKSSSARRVTCLLSAAVSASDKTFSKAAPVEWWRLYADCNRGMSSLASKYSTSCFTATLSTNF